MNSPGGISSLLEYFFLITDMLVDTLDYLPVFFGWLPGEVLALLLGIFGLAAIYRIMGWGG